MDLQERKIHFVQEFLRLNDEEIVHKLEDTLNAEKKKVAAKQIQPMTIEELNRRIDQAENDIKNGRVYTTEELKNEMKSW